MTHRKSARPFQPNIERVSHRRIPKKLGFMLKDPEAWKLYGHYNKMTASELADEIVFWKDTMKYQDEYEFMCELYSRKVSNLPITPL